MRTHTQTSGNLANRVSRTRDLLHRIPLELVAVIACPHLGLLASKLGGQSVYKSGGISISDAISDLHALYLRLTFAIFVSNKDDHLKNHGFLYVGRDRWRLSPVFDVNPGPDRNPYLETAILEDGSNEPSILLALEASEFFELPNAEAKALIRGMADTITALWRETFRQHGVTRPQIRDYEPAFMNDETEITRLL